MTDHAADPSHPRYSSLLQRQKLERAKKLGMLADSALIAHGRGEAFDYLLGEKTHSFAHDAIIQALAVLKQAQHPILSVNGNTVALAGLEILQLASHLSCPVEINIFYRTPERMNALLTELEHINKEHDLHVNILGANPDATIPGLKGPRAKCESTGIFSADVIFVPLEDGDRCQALKKMGKTVIVVDLNPMSRSAIHASITIVNELHRTIEHMIEVLEQNHDVSKIESFSHHSILERALITIRQGEKKD